MQFYLQCTDFCSRAKPFIEMVQKEISSWINKPLPFHKTDRYLDIINVLNVYGDKYTITFPINIAQDNLHVTLRIDFHEASTTLQFQIGMDKLWNISNKLILQPQMIPICNPITSPAMLRKLKHYKGRKQVEFLPLTSFFLTTSDFQNMSWTHEILYDDKAVAFVDIATHRDNSRIQ